MMSVRIFIIIAIAASAMAFDLPFLSERQRGDIDYNARRYTRAIDHYRESIESEGSDWEVTYNLGTALLHDGRYEEAIVELESTLRVAKDSEFGDEIVAQIEHNLGLAYLQADDCEKAISHLDEAAWHNDTDQNIATNKAFADAYCAEQPPQNPDNEGEDENEGEGDQESDQTGQNDQNQNNSETETQDQSDSQNGEDQESDSQDNGESDSEDDQQGDQEQDQSDQGQDGEDQSVDEGEDSEGEQNQDGQEDQQQSDADEIDQDSENGDAQQDDQQSQGNQEDAKDQRGGGGSSPRDIPDDGLPLSDAQIQEILDQMEYFERRNAPRNFMNHPGDGDYMTDENWFDAMQRLLFGLPMENEQYEAEDGIDW
jgi:tetratricopeptide (TPR) repeat protein